mgnify:CR=1 FL=1
MKSKINQNQLNKLEKLANMKEKGLIDEGEFNSKKEELLKKM